MMENETMTPRQKYVDYVKNGGSRVICSPQIGCAGYEAKLYGCKWNSECPFERVIDVTARYKMLPHFNLGIDPLMHASDRIRWITDYARDVNENKKEWHSHCDTPFGRMERHGGEVPHVGGFQTQDAIRGIEDIDKLEWVIDTALEDADFSCYPKLINHYSNLFGDRGPVSVQWAMQPYEMLCYPNTQTTALLPFDDEDKFIVLMEKILKLDMKLIDAVAQSDAEFVFLGGPASEMISPAYYEKYLVPFSKRVTDYAHSKGLLIYSHICSPIEPMLSMGYYNEMGIDLFETLSPRPEGNIKSIDDAFSKLDKKICTRGNVSLAMLITGTPDDVKRSVFEIIEAAERQGRKHIVAASDYLMYDVKEENIIALCDAVEEYYR